MIIWLAIIHPITICLVAASHWAQGILRAALFVVFPYALHGCLFYAFSQVSHVQRECSGLKADGVDRTKFQHPHAADKTTLAMRCQRREIGIDVARTFAAQEE